MRMTYIKNISTVEKEWAGKVFAVDEEYSIPETLLTNYRRDSAVLADIANGLADIGNGHIFFDNPTDRLNWLLGNEQPVVEATIVAHPPFAAKTIGTKKLFRRVHGIYASVSSGANVITYSIPYDWAKITGLELIGGVLGDRASLYVLDTPSGTYSGYPNYQLNQFGFDVCVAPTYYKHYSEFDADLFLDMAVKISYNSVDSKDIGINLILNEVR